MEIPIKNLISQLRAKSKKNVTQLALGLVFGLGHCPQVPPGCIFIEASLSQPSLSISVIAKLSVFPPRHPGGHRRVLDERRFVDLRRFQRV